MNRPCYLYRHFDADGGLLYVGIAVNAVMRQNGHKASCEWFALVRTITIEEFSSLQDARAAEAAAVLQESPVYNTQHSKYNPQLGPLRKGKARFMLSVDHALAAELARAAGKKSVSDFVRGILISWAGRKAPPRRGAHHRRNSDQPSLFRDT